MSKFQKQSPKARSVPGRMGIHSSARAAAGVIIGSMTTTLAPRARASAISLAECTGNASTMCPAWAPHNRM